MPDLCGMDTHTTHRRSPASATQASSFTRTRRGTVVLLALMVAMWGISASAQTVRGGDDRQSSIRQRGICGGDQLDGVCSAECSNNSFDARFDADCLSCAQFEAPQPKPACRTPGQPCEIHEGIIRMGSMVESAVYDDSVMRGIVLAYWDGSAWDLTQHWGASALDGYVVYSVVRTAIEFRADIDNHPTTKMAMECMLRDHSSRGIPTTTRNGTRWFHGGNKDWNSWSEDFMGFALGYAAADSWLATTPAADYNGEYFDNIEEAVDMAYSVDEEAPLALTLDFDPDPQASSSAPVVMIQNHNEYSPVYATVLLKHVADINNIYRAAGLSPRFTCANKPSTYDDLYGWMVSKIEPTPPGAGYVFRNDACQREDGTMSYCDDRPGDPAGSPGFKREPGHYPLAEYLPDLCVAGDLEFFSASCSAQGPSGIDQAPHNYVFNCVFTENVRQ